MTVPADEAKRLSCFHCYFAIGNACSNLLPGFPNNGPDNCDQFCYEPGTRRES